MFEVHSTPRYSILHIDDNYDALNLLKLRLKKFFDVVSLDNPLLAMEYIASRHFDIIVTDYDMPAINGLDLLKTIKEKYPNLPVIFYTGQGSEEVAREAFMAGVSDYLTKSKFEIAHWQKLVNSIKSSVERRTVHEQIKESQRQLAALIQNIPGMVYRCENTPQWTMKFVSENSFALTGYNPDDFIDNKILSYSDIIVSDKNQVWNTIQEKITEHKPFNLEYQILCKDGVIKDVIEYGMAVHNEKDEIIALEGIIMDDTQRKEAERRTQHLNRILKAVNEINQLIVREKSRKKLLENACEILLRNMNYSFVWIGLIDPYELLITPPTYAGSGDESSDNFILFLQEKDYELNPVYKTIKDSAPIVIGNLASTFSHSNWAQEAARMGHHSIACIPLICRGKTYGVLCVYMPEKTPPKQEEIDLLKELGDDIAFALKAIEDEEAKKRNEEILKESETIYHALFENANDGVFLETLEGKIIDANQKACQMLGYSKDEIKNLTVADIIDPDLVKDIPLIIESIVTKGSFCAQLNNKCKDGSLVPVEISASAFKKDEKTQVIALVRDVTERKLTHNALEPYKTAIHEAPCGIIVIDEAGRILIYNRGMQKITGYNTEEAEYLEELLNILLVDETVKHDFMHFLKINLKPQSSLSNPQLSITNKRGEKVLIELFCHKANSGETVIFAKEITNKA